MNINTKSLFFGTTLVLMASASAVWANQAEMTTEVESQLKNQQQTQFVDTGKEVMAQHKAKMAEIQTGDIQQKAEAMRASVPNEIETQVRERATQMQQQAREMGSEMQTRADEAMTGMNVPAEHPQMNFERPDFNNATTQRPVMERPVIAERPNMPERPVQVSRPSFR